MIIKSIVRTTHNNESHTYKFSSCNLYVCGSSGWVIVMTQDTPVVRESSEQPKGRIGEDQLISDTKLYLMLIQMESNPGNFRKLSDVRRRCDYKDSIPSADDS